jgi:sporulation protein YlmC with PRC-barrel domain
VIRFSAIACIVLLAAAAPALAQTAPGTGDPNLSVASVKMDNGVRMSRVIGSAIYLDANTQVGTVNDLVIRPDDKVVLAILSIGGVLGVGGKLVAVPYTQLKFEGGKTLLPGATKDWLNAMPNFTFGG